MPDAYLAALAVESDRLRRHPADPSGGELSPCGRRLVASRWFGQLGEAAAQVLGQRFVHAEP
jgi:hypothetical protein